MNAAMIAVAVVGRTKYVRVVNCCFYRNSRYHGTTRCDSIVVVVLAVAAVDRI